MFEKHSSTMPSVFDPLYIVYESDRSEKRLKMVKSPEDSSRFRVVAQVRKGDTLSDKFDLAVHRFLYSKDYVNYWDNADDEYDIKMKNLVTGVTDVAIWKDFMVLREYATKEEAEKLLRDFNDTINEYREMVWEKKPFMCNYSTKRKHGIENKPVRHLSDFNKVVHRHKGLIVVTEEGRVVRESLPETALDKLQTAEVAMLRQEYEKDQLYAQRHGLKL